MELNFAESKQKTINKIDLQKSPICTWSDLSLVEITKINLCEKCKDVKKFLCDKFGYNNDSLKLTEKINVDLLYHALKFCKDNKFNEEQTSALFTIIKTVHNKNTETSFDNLKPTYEHFRKLLSHHSVKRPPFCVQLYSVKELKLVIDYVTHTYFRHFKLYKYTFTPKVEMNLRVNYIGIPEEPVQEQSEEVNKDEEIDNTEEVKEEEGQATDDVENKTEESSAVKELKQFIESTMEKQISMLRSSLEKKLKENEIIRQVNETGLVSQAKPSPNKTEK